MKPRAQKAAAVALSLFIVGSAVAGPLGPHVVGTATAAFGFQDCDYSDSLVVAFMESFTNPNEEGECRFNPADSDNTAHTDFYADGQELNTTAEIFLTTQQNHLVGQGTQAFMEAKVNISNNINENVTSNETLTADANTTVNESIGANVVNIIQHYSATVSTLEYTYKANESYISKPSAGDIVGFATMENQTFAGYNYSYRTVVVEDSPGSYYIFDFYDEGLSSASDANNSTAYIPAINNNTSKLDGTFGVYQLDVVFTAPPGSGESNVPVDMAAYSDAVGDYTTKRDSIKDQSATYAREANALYEAGDISAVDIAGPDALAAAASTDYENTGSYSYVGANLASLGYAGDLNSSINITWTYTANGSTVNKSLEGHLFTTADNATWNVSESIDVANASGTYYFAAQEEDGNASLQTLNGTITIQSAQNPDTGEELNQVEAESYVRETTDASSLQEDLNRTAELREYYESQQTSSGGVGCIAACGDGSSVLPAETGLYVVLGLAAIILLARP